MILLLKIATTLLTVGVPGLLICVHVNEEKGFSDRHWSYFGIEYSKYCLFGSVALTLLFLLTEIWTM